LSVLFKETLNPTVYILLPVHNRCQITRRFVACLKSQTYKKFHLVLIDDGSTDGTAEMVGSEIASLTVIAGQGDWWWAGALQQGYDWLRKQQLDDSDLVLIINDDTEFENDFLMRAVALLQDQSRSLLLAPSFSRESGQLVSGGVRVDWQKLKFYQTEVPAEINCLATRGLFLKAGDFLELGGFNPHWLPHYLSDYEFTIRAHCRGMKLLIDDSLRLLVDEKLTGYRQFEGGSFGDFCKMYFSRKSDANPFAWSIFIALACPWPWKLTSWLRVWYGTTVKLLGALTAVGDRRQC
jgi:GT2 family glycosyltransferase